MQAFKEYEGVCKYCGCTEIIMEESQERANEEVSRRWNYHNKKEGDCSPSFQCSVIQLPFAICNHNDFQNSCKICVVTFFDKIIIVTKVINEFVEEGLECFVATNSFR